MDDHIKERIEKIDEEIAELSNHASMRSRAGGGSNAVMDARERVKELQLEKEDLINGTNKLSSYRSEKRIREIEYEITRLKALRDEAIFLKRRQYDSEIKMLEEELDKEKGEVHTR